MACSGGDEHLLVCLSAVSIVSCSPLQVSQYKRKILTDTDLCSHRRIRELAFWYEVSRAVVVVRSGDRESGRAPSSGGGKGEHGIAAMEGYLPHPART
ncbi:hypothetical protein J6590_042230 [Homalodisca vitripennis]|nr:hypothetical protein J6590_042230 [Homalodisca vitripennis]